MPDSTTHLKNCVTNAIAAGVPADDQQASVTSYSTSRALLRIMPAEELACAHLRLFTLYPNVYAARGSKSSLYDYETQPGPRCGEETWPCSQAGVEVVQVEEHCLLVDSHMNMQASTNYMPLRPPSWHDSTRNSLNCTCGHIRCIFFFQQT